MDQNVFLADIHPGESLIPQGQGVSIRHRMTIVCQIRYLSIPYCAKKNVLPEYYTNVLKQSGGSMNSRQDGLHLIEEIRVPCFGIHFQDVTRSLGSLEHTSLFPYSLDDLMAFSETIKKHKIVLQTSTRSNFIETISKYFEAWGADLTGKSQLN